MDTLRLDYTVTSCRGDEPARFATRRIFACQQYSYEQSLSSYRFRHGSSARFLSYRIRVTDSIFWRISVNWCLLVEWVPCKLCLSITFVAAAQSNDTLLQG